MDTSRKLLIAEAVVFALPLTVLLGLGVPSVSIPSRDDFWPFGAADLLTVVALVAVVAGWVLLVKAIRGGTEALQRAHRGWWWAASLGVVLVIAAVGSKILPASPEYSPAAIFREHLQACILGLPLVVILAHLWAEARFRTSTHTDGVLT
jgi:uncharacterized membrane protein HdeD (DUF308 family)